MDFIDIIKKRYATKKFTGEMISQEKIDQLFEMIQFAPSSVGLQQFKVKVVTDKETKEKLKPLTYNQEQITTCSHLLVFCAYTDFDDRLKQFQELMKEQHIPDEHIQGFATMAKGYLGMVPPGEAATVWASKQAYIALGNAMNGATALGFDSCPMEGFDAKKYSEILNLPDNVVPVVLCPIGVAADAPKAKIRFPKEDIFF